MHHIHITLIAILPLLVSNAWAQASHCQADEFEYFSCQLRQSKKVVSLCGSTPVKDQDGVTVLPDWLQYRFGLLGKPELVFPRKKAGSTAQFIGEYHHPYEGVYYGLMFTNAGVPYTLMKVNADNVFVGLYVQATPDKFIKLACGAHSNGSTRQAFTELVLTLDPEQAK